MTIRTLIPEDAAETDRRADTLKRTIYEAEDPVRSGPVYYIRSDGDDSRDGTSPDTAWRTLDALNRVRLAPGSSVLFRRGDLWRGSLTAQAGVTYGAYGTGEKPRLYGSPYDGAKDGFWTEVCPRVWRYSERLKDDCGGMVFDGGRSHGLKVTLRTDGDGPRDNVTGEPFRGYFDLTGDLHFWHDLGGNVIRNEEGGWLYLRSESGSPAERFREIEFLPRVHGIAVQGGGVSVDNLRLMYYGAHGIAAGTVDGLRVTALPAPPFSG